MKRTALNKTGFQKNLVVRILEGSGRAPQELRRKAFDDDHLEEPLRSLVDDVALHPANVTNEQILAARASGLTEDQIFELVVCAAVGQSTREYESARAALDAAIAQTEHRHAT